ncbi:ABC transporter permease [Methanococcoides sp. NM1]|uniref:ABC transporter permease n=1 Tax=Methanococcoides sp. NM1 TaxID=1201013 RepID=UPI001082B8B1|nr:ABC transporter permease [Methanococcoides sp. NM1]
MVTIETILGHTGEHLVLLLTTLFVSICISLPLAFASLYSKRVGYVIMKFANLAQAVPSFAVVAIVVPLIGIGFYPALIAILLRALLPIIKNTYIGLSTVDTSMLDYADGIGLNKWQILRYIRLPNAYPAIFAGIKFASILINSIAILTAYIGSGGLGELIFDGLVGFNNEKILAGAIPAILIALTLDVIFTAMEKKLVPDYRK